MDDSTDSDRVKARELADRSGYVMPENIAAHADRIAAALAEARAPFVEMLRQHRCKSDGAMTVAECVDGGRCGCSDGLLIKGAELKG